MKIFIQSYFLIGSFLLPILSSSQSVSEKQKITASDREANENFGFTVDISGDFAIVGTPNEGSLNGKVKSREGAAYIYQKNANGQWTEVQKLVSDTSGTEDAFGKSVAILGKYAFVGASGHRFDENGKNEMRWAGAAYIFERDANGKWNQIQKIVGARQASALFGSSISASQDYLAIGAESENIDASSQHPGISGGTVYIYKKDNGGKWQLEKRIYASDKKKGAYFGKNISLQGTLLAVGAHWETHDSKNENNLKAAGAVYIYKRTSNGDWVETQKIVPSDRAATDFFGCALNLNGKNLGVGAYRKTIKEQTMVGAAYMFRLQEDSTFLEMQKLEASDQGKMDSFGCNIEIEGDIAIVAACGDYDDVNGKNSLLEAGSAYMFIQDECGKWRQVQKFTAKIRGFSADFGYSLAIDGKNAILGAINEDLDFVQQNKIHAAGAVYFFEILGMGTNPCNDGVVQNEVSENIIVTEEKLDVGVSISVSGCKIILTANDNNAKYQWVNCDNKNQPIPNENKQSFQPTSNGNYGVLLTKNNTSTLSDCIHIMLAENIIEETGTNTFKINPNPNNGVFQIETTGKISTRITGDVISPFGKTIKEFTITEALTSIDLGKVTKGVYILRIKTNNEVKKMMLYVD